LVLPPDVSNFRAVGEGIVLGGYRFTKYLTGERRPKRDLERVDVFVQGKVGQAEKDAFELGQAIAGAICVARDAVNEPPNVLYPESFAELCRHVAKSSKLKLKVLDEKTLRAQGHNLHLAVGQGSVHKPCMMHFTYTPKSPKKRIVFVGKGITFDSGGLCIKPMQGMADMKTDMAGAAAVLGLMQAVAAVGPDVEVHGIIGAAENMPDGNAYRPADVLTSLSGKTVEIINTDAEGRLVLADALTYAVRLEPDAIVDAATLTGATLVSLGQPYSAFFANSDELAAAMENAAKDAGESFWRMPLIEELSQQLKSDIADYKHVGDRFGGAISAALFLREFVDGIPWIHCDIPGAVYGDRPSGVYPKGGTGHAVMTFLKLVETFSQVSLGEAPKPQTPRRRRGTPAAPTRRAAVRKPRARGKARRT
jgi:leucyl aminopeptidase